MPLYSSGISTGTSSSVVEVTSTSYQTDPDMTYITNNAARVYLTLPVNIVKGQQIRVRGLGDGGWRIVQNSGQTITSASMTTSGSAGYIESQTASDTMALECVVDNTEFRVIAGQGTKTIA